MSSGTVSNGPVGRERADWGVAGVPKRSEDPEDAVGSALANAGRQTATHAAPRSIQTGDRAKAENICILAVEIRLPKSRNAGEIYRENTNLVNGEWR